MNIRQDGTRILPGDAAISLQVVTKAGM